MSEVKYPNTLKLMQDIFVQPKFNKISTNKAYLNVDKSIVNDSGVDVSLTNSDGTTPVSIPDSYLRHIKHDIHESHKAQIIYKGRILSDNDEETMEHYGFSQNITLSVVGSRSTIYVRIEWTDGRSFVLCVESSDRIYKYESDINEKIRFNRQEHRLKYNESMITFRDTFQGRGILEDCVLQVIDRLKDDILINIVYMGTRTDKFPISKSAGINELKEKIERKVGLPQEYQRLLVNGVTLDDGDMTLDEGKIDGGSDLYVLDKRRMGMLVSFRSLKGAIGSLELIKSELIEDVMRRIGDVVGSSSSVESLAFRGQILAGDRSVGDCGIGENENLLVVMAGIGPTGMEIFVRLSDGRRISLVILECATIKQMKLMIQEKTGLLSEELLLEYRGWILEDYETLDKCQISEGSVINILDRPKGGMMIFAETMDGRRIAFEISKGDKVIDIRRKIEARLGLTISSQFLEYRGYTIKDDQTVAGCQISAGSIIDIVGRHRGGMIIFIKECGGRRIAIEVSKNDRIIDLKMKIQERLSLRLEEQIILVFQGGILKDDKSAGDYRICEESVIDVVTTLRGAMKIFAKTLDGKTIAFEISKNDRIIDIKMKIQEMLGLIPDDQKLEYQGWILEDDKSVGDCHIAEKSVINVVTRWRGGGPPMKIFAKTEDGKSISIEMSCCDRIINLKNKIKEKVGLAPEEQKLKYQGILLEDDKFVGEYQIREMSVINVVAKLREMQICVMTEDGKSVSLYVTNCDTVADLRRRIEERTGLLSKEQTLIYRGRLLEDDETMWQCRIDDASVINIPMRLRDFSIRVKFSGNQFGLRVTSADTIIEIKKKIEGQLGLPSDEQLLKIRGTILRYDSRTLHECQITENDIIEVSPLERLTINVQTRSIETVVIEIFKSDRIVDIREKIRAKTDIERSDRILILENITDDEEKTVAEALINDRQDIYVKFSLNTIEDEEGTRGVCAVISNEKFQNNAPRVGTKIDEEKLRKTFTNLRYEFEVFPDLLRDDVDSIIEKIKEKLKESHKLLIVFVLSHGEENGVILSDGELLSFESFSRPFSNQNLKTFVGKPKAFFFGCCRGSSLNMGVGPPINCVAETRTPNIEYDSPNTPSRLYPSEGDMFIGYSTVKCFLSCRYPTEGTLYIQHLCEVITDHPIWSLSDIHQEVQRRVSQINIGGENHFQMPECVNSLTTHAYLVPEDD